jgi:hypothetical protein
MSLRAWIDPRIAQVRVDGVRAYLTERGWIRQPYPRPEVLVFAGPLDDNGEPMILLLPAVETLADYRMRLEELIEALSAVEDRHPVDILTAILEAGSSPPVANGAATSVTPSPTTGR